MRSAVSSGASDPARRPPTSSTWRATTTSGSAAIHAWSRRLRPRRAQWGAGAGASRLVTGTLELHAELESAFAEFTGQPAALVFSTGYQANLGVVAALTDPDTLIVSDAHVHASLVDACRLAKPGAW